MSTVPLNLSHYGNEYTAEGINETDNAKKIVGNAKNSISDTMNKPPMNQLLEVGKKIGDFFNRAKRLTYIPKIAGALLAGALIISDPQEGNAQFNYRQLGVYGNLHSEHNNVYANKDNGHTYDGWSTGLNYTKVFGDGGVRGRWSLNGGVGHTQKYQDANTFYNKLFVEAKTNIGLGLYTDETPSESLYGIFITGGVGIEKEIGTAVLQGHTVYLQDLKPFLDLELGISGVFNQYAGTDIIGFIRWYPSSDKVGKWDDYKVGVVMTLGKILHP